MTLHDSTTVSREDLSYNFFIDDTNVGQNLASAMIKNVQELNSYARVHHEDKPFHALTEEFFDGFDVISYGGWSEVGNINCST